MMISVQYLSYYPFYPIYGFFPMIYDQFYKRIVKSNQSIKRIQDFKRIILVYLK